MPCTFRCFSRHYFAQPSRMDCPGFTRLGVGPAPPWHRRRAVQRVGHSVLPPADKRLMRPRQPATRPAHLKHHKNRLPDRRPSLPWPPPRGRTRVQGIGSPAVTRRCAPKTTVQPSRKMALFLHDFIKISTGPSPTPGRNPHPRTLRGARDEHGYFGPSLQRPFVHSGEAELTKFRSTERSKISVV